MTLLVIGASSDMGAAVIKEISEKYTCIIAHYFHMNEKLQELKNSLGDKLVLIQADLSIEEDVWHLIEEVKLTGRNPSHIIHFPAQRIEIQKFIKTEWDVFRRGIEISLKSLVLILQSLLPEMVKKKYGRIIIVLSYVLDGMPPKYSADYVVTKYALLGMVKSLAVEYGDKGITVNGISPGFTETKFINNMQEYFKEVNRKASPIGRNLTVDDIVPTIAYLLSKGGDCINGQNISITCGR